MVKAGKLEGYDSDQAALPRRGLKEEDKFGALFFDSTFSNG